jgi:hypothetical protein
MEILQQTPEAATQVAVMQPTREYLREELGVEHAEGATVEEIEELTKDLVYPTKQPSATATPYPTQPPGLIVLDYDLMLEVATAIPVDVPDGCGIFPYSVQQFYGKPTGIVELAPYEYWHGGEGEYTIDGNPLSPISSYPDGGMILEEGFYEIPAKDINLVACPVD